MANGLQCQHDDHKHRMAAVVWAATDWMLFAPVSSCELGSPPRTCQGTIPDLAFIVVTPSLTALVVCLNLQLLPSPCLYAAQLEWNSLNPFASRTSLKRREHSPKARRIMSNRIVWDWFLVNIIATRKTPTRRCLQSSTHNEVTTLRRHWLIPNGERERRSIEGKADWCMVQWIRRLW